MTTLFRDVNRYWTEEDVNQWIHESNTDNRKEIPPQYALVSVNFNISIRVTKLEFGQTQKYRTIERYVTCNYTKYPIYSHWETKSKIILKSIKLTNEELESLNIYPDPLIQKIADQIVSKLHNNTL